MTTKELIFSAGLSIRQPMTCRFEPQPDITAYELAKLFPYLQGQPLYPEGFEALGWSVTRHLVVISR